MCLILLRIHAVCVCDNAAHFHKDINSILDKLGPSEGSEGKPGVRSKDIIDIIEGYEGRGYGLSTDEELGMMVHVDFSVIMSRHQSCFFILAQLVEISSRTGIVLDPVYTLKGVRGMLAELKKNPKRFKGNRILYIHTGLFIWHGISILLFIKSHPCIGGVFGAFDGRFNELLKRTPLTNQVYSHVDIVPDQSTL